MKHVRLVVLALIMASISVMPVIGGGQQAEGEAGEERIEIRFHHHEARYSELLNDVVAEFEAQNPNIDIVPEMVPWVEAFSLLINQRETGNLPDIFIPGNTWVAPFAQQGMILDLTDRIEAWERNGAPISEDFYEGDGLFYNLDNKWYGLPYASDTRMLFYRTDYLEEAGLDVPTTHEEFVEVAKALTDPENGVWGYGLLGSPDGVTFQTIANWTIQRGGFLFKEGPNGELESNVNSPEFVEAIRWYTDLHLEHKVSPPGAPNYALADAESGFQSGALAMIITGPWFIPQLDENPNIEGKWAAAPLPAGPENDTTFLGGYPLVISTHSEHPDAAWKFMQYMVSRDALLPYSQATNIPPAYQSMAEGYAGSSDALQVQINSLQKAVPNSYPFEAPPILASMTDGEMPVQQEVQAILAGNKSVEEAMQDAHDTVNKMFADFRARQ